MNNIVQELEPLKDKLRNHSLYNNIKDVEDLKIFSSAHVYAVWDFMSLLKFLQIKLTSTSLPWFPSENNTTAKLINEIVAGEETDEDQNANPMSHFEMYINSIQEFGLDTDEILNNINSLNKLESIEEDIDKLDIKDYVKNFLKFTFSVIKRGNVHEVASVFTFGREDLIPDMFIPLIEGINAKNNDLNKLIYYFKRHIEVDGDLHGPMSMEMLSYLCNNDAKKISEASSISNEALLARISLWDGIENEIKQRKKTMKKLNTLFLILTLSTGCSQEIVSSKYAESINSNDLEDLLSVYSSDGFEGRQTGTKGDRTAANFLRDFYISNKIGPALNTIDYFQPYQLNLPGKMYTFNYSFPSNLEDTTDMLKVIIL